MNLVESVKFVMDRTNTVWLSPLTFVTVIVFVYGVTSSNAFLSSTDLRSSCFRPSSLEWLKRRARDFGPPRDRSKFSKC